MSDTTKMETRRPCPCPAGRKIVSIADVDIRVSNKLLALQEERRAKAESFISGIAVGLMFSFLVFFFFPLLVEKK